MHSVVRTEDLLLLQKEEHGTKERIQKKKSGKNIY